jgi:hypothetical protein
VNSYPPLKGCWESCFHFARIGFRFQGYRVMIGTERCLGLGWAPAKDFVCVCVCACVSVCLIP